MEHISLSSPIGTPKTTMLEQFQWIAEEVMPALNPPTVKTRQRPESLRAELLFVHVPFVLAHAAHIWMGSGG